MREIKFRAWDSYHKEMFQVHSLGSVDSLSDVLKFGDGTPLMQYTGLEDKNGKEIYEGDIVKIKAWFRDDEVDKICITIMDGWQSVFEAARNTEDGFYCPMGSTAQNDREVIGNIYESPSGVEEENDRRY